MSVRSQPLIGRSPGWRAAGGGGLALMLFAACSAPSPEGLFSPVLVARSGGSGGSGGNASDPGELNLSPLGGAGNGEGGSELSFAGAGGGSGGTDVGSGGSGATNAGLSDAGTPPDAGPPCVAETEVCDGLDNDCNGDVDQGMTCPPQCAGFSLEERSYMFCAQQQTRAQALSRCGEEGMRLVWLETPTESTAVREQITALGLPAPPDNAELLTQIGGSDDVEDQDEGEWFWVGTDVAPNGFQFWNGDSDGEAVGNAYVDWSEDEPTGENEDCAALIVLETTRVPGQWDDRSCNEQLPFLCEIP